MPYLVWAMPALFVVAAIVSGRVSVAVAALLGLVASIPVAVWDGVTPFGFEKLGLSLARGAWIGLNIAPYVFGGLLFWRVASRYSSKVDAKATQHQTEQKWALSGPTERRRRLFFATFLVGPFAESATGFGVGMLGTVGMLQKFDIAPRFLMVFAMLSQTMIPWGAMSSGTVLASAYARITPTTLGLHATVPVALLMPVWLAMFWRTARNAGIASSVSNCVREAVWIASGLLLLAAATATIGPETALLASYGMLISVYYLLTERPNSSEMVVAARKVLPFILLISGLALTRLHPGIRGEFSSLLNITPFADLPSLRPLLHAGIWLIVGALVTAALTRQADLLWIEAMGAWKTAHQAILTAFFFAMMAEVTTGAGIASAIANGLMTSLRENAVLLAPLVSGSFGILANSGNPPNSLFLPSLQALSVQAGLSVAAVAAVQHVSGMSLGFFSPVRMTIAATLSDGKGQERSVYLFLLPYVLASFSVMTAIAFAVISISY
ncbi:hypothetical protein [Cupriavidus taiwanensis]|uniref:hypothetical protein n=1 Tax=Cupriavidus taiwanensis TaxID=164546 RepID=UPI0039C191C3